jgi:hypothetical protein
MTEIGPQFFHEFFPLRQVTHPQTSSKSEPYKDYRDGGL